MFELDEMTVFAENVISHNSEADSSCAPDSPSGGDCDNGYDCWP